MEFKELNFLRGFTFMGASMVEIMVDDKETDNYEIVMKFKNKYGVMCDISVPNGEFDNVCFRIKEEQPFV